MSGGSKGRVAHYLARVLRLRAGDEFVAFDPAGGTEADAVVLHVQGDAIAVRFGATRPGRAAAPRELTWIQGFAKGDKCDAIVRDATELGATRIVIASTRRSVVRLDDARASARVTRWSRIAEEAARQCGRSEAPRVDRPMPWADALACAGAGDARFCLWERATEPLAPRPLRRPRASAPPSPSRAAQRAGSRTTKSTWRRAARLEDRHRSARLLLRTETVAAAVLGAVRVWSGLGRSGA